MAPTIIYIDWRFFTMQNEKKIGKAFMVLDVEGMSICRPYNIGYLICDKFGNIFLERSFAVLPCIWENLQNCLQAKEMTHKNIEEILSDIENTTKRKYVYNSIEEVKKLILSDCIKYHIKEIWAYNCAFDKGSLRRLFADDWEMLDNLVTFYDIIPAIVHTTLLSKKYVKWCNENKFITKKGNVMTKAEIVYKYLTGDNNFVEEHTGLNDCRIEYYILLTAINSGKKIDRSEKRPAWKVFKEFCAVEGIETIIPE